MKFLRRTHAQGASKLATCRTYVLKKNQLKSFSFPTRLFLGIFCAIIKKLFSYETALKTSGYLILGFVTIKLELWVSISNASSKNFSRQPVPENQSFLKKEAVS